MAFRRMIDENEKNLFQALKKDLNKSYSESLNTEIEIVRSELIHHIDNFEKWIKPRRVSTDILNLGGSSYIKADPLGVCLIIGAWNYPIHLTLIPMIGCISAGNCLLVKTPSNKYSSFSSFLLTKLIKRYLNPLTVRVVQGNREITSSLLEQKYDLIFFTGGSLVGRMIAKAAAKTLTPIILELGGKSPVVIDKNINIYNAAKRIAWGRFLNAGQTCVAADYVLVHQEIGEKFMLELKRITNEFYSDFSNGNEHFGRIINYKAWKRLKFIIEKDKKYIRFGGETDFNSLFISPTLLDFGNDQNAFKKSEAMCSEIFGPILPCLCFKDLDVVISFVAGKEKPLTLYVFSQRKEFFNRILQETSSGNAMINDVIVFISNNNLPFGGIGKSGIGRYHGKYSFDTFSHLKGVMEKNISFDDFSRYPPYDVTKNILNSFVMKINQMNSWECNTLLWIAYTVVFNAIYRRKKNMDKVIKLLVYIIYGPSSNL